MRPVRPSALTERQRQDLKLLTRALTETMKAHTAGRGEEHLGVAIGGALGWALRLCLEAYGWSPAECGEFARSLTETMQKDDAAEAS